LTFLLGKPLRALIVEHCEDDARMLILHLEREGLAVESERVETPATMLAALRARPWDVVISDYSMPAFRAPEAAALLRQHGPDIPFIIVSGTVGEEIAVAALKAGAHDFLTKDSLSRLIPAIEREMRDAAERRRHRSAEAALTDTRERMNLALEAAGVGTWEWDLVIDTVVWSELLERLHGLEPGTFRGTHEAFLDLIHPEDQARVRAGREPFAANPGGVRIEYRVTWPDGSEHWIASTGRAFFDAAGRPVRAAGFSVDITEHKRLQEQLLQARKMESIGNLAGGIAHDFNNLLTAITGYCQLLLDRPGLDPDVVGDLEEIYRASDRGAALTKQLLAFSRKQLLAPRVVNLNELIRDLRPMLHRLIEEHVQLVVRLAPDVAHVNVDPGQIDQVVMNLVINARDAMPDGGTLTIETANLTLDTEYTESGARMPVGRYVLLVVRDTGQGMPPEVQRRLFEPFFTTKPKGAGTGLGLATVYGIVKQSDGFIFVSSEPGKGTSFRVYFPVAPRGTQAESPTSAAVVASVRGQETVLIVEDDARLRALDERILQRYGYRVLVAGGADDAIRTCSDYVGPIHVVLTDVIMPGGSGRTLGDWVAEHRPDTRVIYMSGYTDDAIAHHGVLEPGIHFIQKPFSPEELVHKVREALS
jgi:PAS domain S-box-containing protein